MSSLAGLVLYRLPVQINHVKYVSYLTGSRKLGFKYKYHACGRIVEIVMAKRDATKEKLAALKALEDAPLNQEMEKELKKSLARRNNIIVSKAAEIVGKRAIENLIPALLKAFDRLMENPEKTDQGCWAKEAIIEALNNLEYDQEDIFLRAITYHQNEPAYGKSVDTAAVLRGNCAFALVRLGYPDVVFELTDLLADPEPQARIAAVRALAGISRDQSEPLLRLNVLTDISKVIRNQHGEMGKWLSVSRRVPLCPCADKSAMLHDFCRTIPEFQGFDSR